MVASIEDELLPNNFRIVKMLVKLEKVKTSQLVYTEPD